jgi:hypothetical protein
MNRRLAKMLLAGLLTAAGRPVAADWINLTGAEVAPNIAEIQVQEDGVRVALEVYVGDLEKFSDLIPAAWFDAAKADVAPDHERVQRFGREGLTVRDESGATLPVELRTAERRMRVDRRSPFAGMINPFTGARAPQPPADKRVLYAELFYAFTGGRPGRLTFAPPMNAEGVPRASIGMIVSHRSVPVIDFRYFAGPATLTLDWDDPWYSRFDRPNLKRHHRYPRMAFLYAEPYEIRHEALLRVRDAAGLTGVRPAGRVLTTEEAARLKVETAAAVAARSPMTVDGAPVTPDFDRAAFMRIGLRGLEILNDGEPVDVDAAILGLIYSVPVDGYPKQATVEWTLFDERATEVPGYAIDAAGPFLAGLTPDDPVLTWTNHFKRPPVPPVAEVAAREWAEIRVPALSAAIWLAALVLAARTLGRGAVRRRLGGGALATALAASGFLALPLGTLGVPRPGFAPAQMTAEQAAALTEQLLANVYRAFDFRGETPVYDRLAKTVDGALLEQVYLDQRRTLRIARAGGAEARVKAVDVESAAPSHVPGTGADFVVRTRWSIVGTVGHWGHVHQRQNRYEADLTLSAAGGAWKITGFDVREQERLSP